MKKKKILKIEERTEVKASILKGSYNIRYEHNKKSKNPTLGFEEFITNLNKLDDQCNVEILSILIYQNEAIVFLSQQSIIGILFRPPR